MTCANERYALDLCLIEDCVHGSAQAWAELVSRHELDVFYALRNAFRVHHVHATEDLLSELQAEIFFRLVRNDFRRLRKFDGRCSLKHWLKVVSSNFVIDYLRKKR
ncbi:MAG: sigma-70 family RNA polymerase sigma factor, partial [Myxococcales bacterium]|nr:sigma-70 family RNA polymerase sigma factor [Myxococcales bacterium]